MVSVALLRPAEPDYGRAHPSPFSMNVMDERGVACHPKPSAKDGRGAFLLLRRSRDNPGWSDKE